MTKMKSIVRKLMSLSTTHPPQGLAGEGQEVVDWPQSWLTSVSNESLNNPPVPGSSRGGAGSGGLASELANISK